MDLSSREILCLRDFHLSHLHLRTVPVPRAAGSEDSLLQRKVGLSQARWSIPSVHRPDVYMGQSNMWQHHFRGGYDHDR
jgi:hypothetical protein